MPEGRGNQNAFDDFFVMVTPERKESSRMRVDVINSFLGIRADGFFKSKFGAGIRPLFLLLNTLVPLQRFL